MNTKQYCVLCVNIFCFILETRNSSHNRLIHNPGRNHGLTLDLTVEQEKYYGMATMEAGFKVHVHGQQEWPLVADHGFAVMPGTATFVAISRKKVQKSNSMYISVCLSRVILENSVDYVRNYIYKK